MLVLVGADDLNIDPHDTISTYEQLLGDQHDESRFQIVVDATHSLLDSGSFNFQTPQDWGVFAWLSFLWQGRDAYAGGVIEELGAWMLHRTEDKK